LFESISKSARNRVLQRLRKAITPQQDEVETAVTLTSTYGTHV
jgi:hypothetical protein